MLRRVSLAILFLSVFIDLIGFGMVIPFLSFYAREYGASGTTVGAVVGVYSIMQFFFAPIWGRLSDRIGRRPVLLLGLTASCTGYALFAVAHGLGLLFASRVIAGAGGATIGTAQAYIADVTTPENRAKGMGLIGAAFGMGFILGPPLSGILSTIGLHHHLAGNLIPGAVAASLSFCALVVALIWLAESKKPGTPVRTGLPPQFNPKMWVEVGERRMLLAIMATLFLMLLAVAGMETSVTLHARDRFNFSQLDLAYFFLFMGVVVATIQGGLIGKLARRFGERTLVAVGTASYTIGLALVPTIWRVPLLYVVAFLVSIGTGLCYPSLTSMVTKATPPAEHGSMLGIATAVGSLARFIGPIVMGFLYDLAQSRGAFYGGAALTAAAFIVALMMRRMPLLEE